MGWPPTKRVSVHGSHGPTPAGRLVAACIQADELQAALGIRTVRLHRCLGIDPVTELAAALKDAVKPTRLYEVRPQIGPLQSERANEAPDRTSCRPPGMSAVRGFTRRTCAPNG